MDYFKEASAQHFALVGVLLGVVFLGYGTTVPPQQGSLGPPSDCDVQYIFFQVVNILQHFMSCVVLAAAYFAIEVRYRVETAGGLQGLPEPERKTARRFFLLSIVCSTATTVLAAVYYFFLLQIKYVKFSCMPRWIQILVILAYLGVAGGPGTVVYRLTKVAMYSN